MEGASVPCICGPTASGKTAVALALAKLLPIDVISADSRQVYRGLDIGTAKPSRAERAEVPHRGLDVVGPAERYSAGRFARDAAEWIALARERERTPVVVGGTGLYLRALFEGLFEQPEQPADRVERLRDALGALGPEELDRWARRLDAAFTPSRNPQRAQRAIEVALLAGRPLSRLQQDLRSTPAARPVYFVLQLPREILAQRIRERVRAMIAAGLVDEVRAALASGVPREAPGFSGVGYPEALAHLAGAATLDAMEAAIVVATRQYAKRQETWFRHQLGGPVTILDATDAPDQLARAVLSGYRAGQTTVKQEQS